MDSQKQLIIAITVFTFIMFTGPKINQPIDKNLIEINFTACTPGDQFIKSVFNIHPETKVDFIRWNLTLKNQKTFMLHLEYGESKPNTLGFIESGKQLTLEGVYTISLIDKNNVKRTIYHLKSANGLIGFDMVKINENLLHLLTPENELMIGNGGWSYTLNRKEPVRNDVLPSLTPSALLLKTPATQTIYIGRTPCSELAGEANMNVPIDCFKLKWKLTLNRDPVTFASTTYQLLRPPYRQSEFKGTWSIVKGTPANADAVIYKLEPPEHEKSVSLLVADENIIYFLDKNDHLLTGNQNFSYTLNRLNN